MRVASTALTPDTFLYDFVYDIDYSDLREYNYTLGKISGNLNQIAKRMNATGNVYKADVVEVKKLMKQVWDTHKYATDKLQQKLKSDKFRTIKKGVPQ